jgi:hypothetical protein
LLPPVFLDYYLNDAGGYDVPRHPLLPENVTRAARMEDSFRGTGWDWAGFGVDAGGTGAVDDPLAGACAGRERKARGNRRCAPQDDCEGRTRCGALPTHPCKTARVGHP